jgi:hypothetical protein
MCCYLPPTAVYWSHMVNTSPRTRLLLELDARSARATRLPLWLTYRRHDSHPSLSTSCVAQVGRGQCCEGNIGHGSCGT